MTKEPIDGFRGIKWGESLSKYKYEFKLSIPWNPEMRYCFERNSESATIGGAKTGKFIYVFDEGGFSSARVALMYRPNAKYKDPEEPISQNDINNRFSKIYNACVKQWGIPKKTVNAKDKTKVVYYNWYSYARKNENGNVMLVARYRNDKLWWVEFEIYSDSSIDREEARNSKTREKYQDF